MIRVPDVQPVGSGFLIGTRLPTLGVERLVDLPSAE